MFRQLLKRFSAILFLVFTVSIASLSILSASPAGGTETTLRAQLEALAASSGVVISGLDHISAGAAYRSVKGTLEERLKSLLEDYNYMVVEPSSGQIEKVIIISLKQPPDKRYISPYVASTRVVLITRYRPSSSDRTTRVAMWLYWSIRAPRPLCYRPP